MHGHLAIDMNGGRQLECGGRLRVNRSIHQGQFAYAEKETQHGRFSVSKLADQSSEGLARGWRGAGQDSIQFSLGPVRSFSLRGADSTSSSVTSWTLSMNGMRWWGVRHQLGVLVNHL